MHFIANNDTLSDRKRKEIIMKQHIVIVSHCFLNDAVKLRNQDLVEFTKERDQKRIFLSRLLCQGTEIIQLPCPEFLLYGSNRWGHVSSQFDTPYFRREARKMLEPIVMQLEEYGAYPERYDILGVIGIEGSPSCGVNYTYDGDWGGALEANPQLTQTLHALQKVNKPGIFIEEFIRMLHEKNLSIKVYSLDTFNEHMS